MQLRLFALALAFACSASAENHTVPLSKIYLENRDLIMKQACNENSALRLCRFSDYASCQQSVDAVYTSCYQADMRSQKLSSVSLDEAKAIGQKLLSCTVQSKTYWTPTAAQRDCVAKSKVMDGTRITISQSYLANYAAAGVSKTTALEPSKSGNALAPDSFSARYLQHLKGEVELVQSIKHRLDTNDRSFCPQNRGGSALDCVRSALLTLPYGTSSMIPLTTVLVVAATFRDQKERGSSQINVAKMILYSYEIIDRFDTRNLVVNRLAAVTAADQQEQREVRLAEQESLVKAVADLQRLLNSKLAEMSRQPANARVGELRQLLQSIERVRQKVATRVWRV